MEPNNPLKPRTIIAEEELAKAMAEVDRLDPNVPDVEVEDEDPEVPVAPEIVVTDPESTPDTKEEDKEVSEAPASSPDSTPESEEKPKEDAPEDNDLKKRYTESTREAQKLFSDKVKINEAIEQGKNLPEPTEEEMKVKYGEWDIMSDIEKRLAKDTYISTRRLELIDQASQESRDIQKWHEKVDSFIDNPENIIKHPALDGREDDFKIFAADKLSRGVAFEILVPAFIQAQAGKQPVAHKGKSFETGASGGQDRPKPKDGKISLATAEALKSSNYSKYKEYLLADKIADE